MNELPDRRAPSEVWRARLGNSLSQAAKDMAAALDEVVPPGFAVIASWVHPEPEIVLVHEGIGIRGIVLSPNGQLDSVDDLPPYLDAVLSEALTQFQDEVVTELGRAWPELPDTGGLALRGTRIDGEVLRAWYGDERDPVVSLRPVPLPRAA
jgi:hypothetical protein